jgi:hypothetical protein
MCLEGNGPTKDGAALATRLDEPKFGYLSNKDKLLWRQAVLLRCNAFLTVEQRLPRNAAHIERELSIVVLTLSRIGTCFARGRRCGASFVRNTAPPQLDFGQF